MKICIIGTHNFPIPYKTHSGDLFYAELAQTYDNMGHNVTFIAPENSQIPTHGEHLIMSCSYGQAVPSSIECEQLAFNSYYYIIKTHDIVHDFSITKRIADNLVSYGFKNVISTPLCGDWRFPTIQHNIVVVSEAMKQRGLRGATDYEGTPTPDMAGPSHPPIKNAEVVHLGIDTDFYYPTYNKQDYFLWMGRWHEVRGYKLAIELAKLTGINLILSGKHPEDEIFDYQKKCALEAIDLAKNHSNIKFEYLPDDSNHHIRKRELLQQAQAFLYPVQFQEPMGLSQLESLACGTPIIGTNYGSVPEVIENKTGILCNNNLLDFANATLQTNKLDPKICRERAIKRFDLKVMAFNYIKLYRRVMQGESW